MAVSEVRNGQRQTKIRGNDFWNPENWAGKLQECFLDTVSLEDLENVVKDEEKVQQLSKEACSVLVQDAWQPLTKAQNAWEPDDWSEQQCAKDFYDWLVENTEFSRPIISRVAKMMMDSGDSKTWECLWYQHKELLKEVRAAVEAIGRSGSAEPGLFNGFK